MKHRRLFQRLLLMALLAGVLVGCSVPDSTPLAQWRHAQDGAFAADISPSGQYAVVSGVNGEITVWHLKDNKPLYQWRHQGEGANRVFIIHISADEKFVVTSDREAFALWNMESGEPVGFWRIDESSIRDVAVSAGGKGILVGRANGKAMFFEPSTGRRLEFLGHQEKINSVDLSPNGEYALTGSNDYVAYLWSTKTGQIVHTFPHPSRVTLVALDDEGRYVFTADSQQKSQIWNAQTAAPVSNLQYIARQKIFTDAVFSKDGEYLLTGAPSRRIYRWNVKTGESAGGWRVAPVENTRPATAVVYAVGFTADGQILSESSSGLAELWSVNNE
ncbi:hypothetical protein CA267_008630 [Alteromonas pelagimontana]|uniref:Uncharacterized protein n=2 Tax=Alteromonas pelagimontana TaxID=1858656 RepID=A0A6M4MCB0_9ALTE|nr:hypothetical protein CA267_008630 [Alteromonas pelagimontana]